MATESAKFRPGTIMRFLLRAGYSPFEVSEAKPPNRAGFGNSGNFLFAQSVYKSLYRPEAQIDLDRYNPDLFSADDINEKYDALVLPLANAFRPQFEDVLRQYTALIRGLKIPCVVVGVGVQAGLDLAELKGSSIDPTVRAFVAAVLDRSATIGVRGAITADYLRRLGFDAVDVIGCPSMFLNGAGLRVRKGLDTLDAGDAIAVNQAQNVRPEIGEFVRGALKAYPNGLFVAQSDANARDWSGAAGNRVRHFRDAPPWLALLKTRVFSIGSRIHGNIAALLAGIPALVLAHDSRTLELCRYHKIPHVLGDTIAETTRLAGLYEAADFGPMNAAGPGLFDRYREFLAKNGLEHALDDPRNAATFEARLATMAFPNGFPA